MPAIGTIGEIQLLAFDFAPRGWLPCDGRILQISANQALFSLLGTTYGGDGLTTFAIPDLRGRTAVNSGIGNGLPFVDQGQQFGTENHTLLASQIPAHTHSLGVSNAAATLESPNNATLAKPEQNLYANANNLVANSSTSTVGNSQSHNNMQPFLVLNYCICEFGLFPSRN